MLEDPSTQMWMYQVPTAIPLMAVEASYHDVWVIGPRRCWSNRFRSPRSSMPCRRPGRLQKPAGVGVVGWVTLNISGHTKPHRSLKGYSHPGVDTLEVLVLKGAFLNCNYNHSSLIMAPMCSEKQLLTFGHLAATALAPQEGSLSVWVSLA